MTSIAKYDLAIAYDWVYDQDFVAMLAREAKQQGLTTLIVDETNLPDVLADVVQQKITLSALIDRASDTSPRFLPLQECLINSGALVIDPLPVIHRASDKATMHLEFIANGLNTPYTIILQPFHEKQDLMLQNEDLVHLGRSFIIKPANTTGGGIGVVSGAETLYDVIISRQEFKKDKYLLQEKVKPLTRDDKRFWFRCFYTSGLINCLWWNEKTHIFAKMTAAEITTYHLKPLFYIVKKIARISHLTFFSSEIVLTHSGQFVIVDYVNDSCDMRLQSKHADGVPDQFVYYIARRLIRTVRHRLSEKKEPLLKSCIDRFCT